MKQAYPETREQRIEAACECLGSERTRKLFRELAASNEDASVFWDDTQKTAMLENEEIIIEVTTPCG